MAAEAQLIVEAAPELVVSFSPANLRSLVYNLLINSIKYRAPDYPPQVRVSAEQMPQAVVLTVRDNGLGLSALQQRDVGELVDGGQEAADGIFQRLHTHVEGTGVGLYMIKRLLENAEETIAFQSQVDAGATFTVTFPTST